MEIPYCKRLLGGAVATSEACFGVVTEGVLPTGTVKSAAAPQCRSPVLFFQRLIFDVVVVFEVARLPLGGGALRAPRA